MKSIWYIFDNCPEDFGQKEIVGDKGFQSKALAMLELNKRKLRAPYETQYYEVRKMNIVGV